RAEGHSIHRRRLRDLDRLGLDDDREPEGTHEAGRGRPLRQIPRPDHGRVEVDLRRTAARKARGLLRSARVPGADQVRHAPLAHVEGRARRQRRHGFDGRRGGGLADGAVGDRRQQETMMRMEKQTTLTRDIEAREIPSGIPITLKAGDPVAITQSLGGSYTVLTTSGYMARVEGKDADAIGEQVVAADAAADAGKSVEELCWDQLRTCYDPEIPVNIVDLGLV